MWGEAARCAAGCGRSQRQPRSASMRRAATPRAGRHAVACARRTGAPCTVPCWGTAASGVPVLFRVPIPIPIPGGRSPRAVARGLPAFASTTCPSPTLARRARCPRTSWRAASRPRRPRASRSRSRSRRWTRTTRTWTASCACAGPAALSRPCSAAAPVTAAAWLARLVSSLRGLPRAGATRWLPSALIRREALDRLSDRQPQARAELHGPAASGQGEVGL